MTATRISGGGAAPRRDRPSPRPPLPLLPRRVSYRTLLSSRRDGTTTNGRASETCHYDMYVLDLCVCVCVCINDGGKSGDGAPERVFTTFFVSCWDENTGRAGGLKIL